MDDFNADNAKIDAALKAEADARTALAGVVAAKGNCYLDAFTYTGNGKYGSQNPTTIQFTHGEAALVVVMNEYSNLFIVHNDTLGNSGITQISWTPTGVSWYYSSPNDQWNTSGAIYHVYVFYALK